MQRYFAQSKKENNFILSDDDWYHIKTVMRTGETGSIEVVYNREAYVCNILNSEVCISHKLDNPVLNQEVILVIPVLKEAKMDLILQKATELGVSKIIPIVTKRSVVKVNGKEEKKLMRWRKICKEAAEQSKRVDIPQVDEIKVISDLQLDGLKIICSTSEKSQTLKNLLLNNSNYDKITIVVGPEGGLDFKEEEELKQLGFIPVTLGSLIMRVETVPIYLLSVLSYSNMEWFYGRNFR